MMEFLLKREENIVEKGHKNNCLLEVFNPLPNNPEF